MLYTVSVVDLYTITIKVNSNLPYFFCRCLPHTAFFDRGSYEFMINGCFGSELSFISGNSVRSFVKDACSCLLF